MSGNIGANDDREARRGEEGRALSLCVGEYVGERAI
jgi:hypothetical protein